MMIYPQDLESAMRRAAELDRANEELRARNAELEAQLAPKSEEELAGMRLEAALARERAEQEARERARRDEEQLRAFAAANAVAAVEQRREARRLVVLFALIASSTAGARHSLAAIEAIIVAAAVIFALLGLWGKAAT